MEIKMYYDVSLSSYEMNRLLDVLAEQRKGVESGSIVGEMTREEELDDINKLIAKLEHAHPEL